MDEDDVYVVVVPGVVNCGLTVGIVELDFESLEEILKYYRQMMKKFQMR